MRRQVRRRIYVDCDDLGQSLAATLVTFDDSSRVNEVVDALAHHLGGPSFQGSNPLLEFAGQVVARNQSAVSAIADGARYSLVRRVRTDSESGETEQPNIAGHVILRDLAMDRVIRLGPGRHTIGTSARDTVVIDTPGDPGTIAAIEVRDDGPYLVPANGGVWPLIGSRLVTKPTPLFSEQEFTISGSVRFGVSVDRGDSEADMTVRGWSPAAERPEGVSLEVVREPSGPSLVAFPWVTCFGALVMASVLFAISGPRALPMMLISPFLAIGHWWERRRRHAIDWGAGQQQYEREMANLGDRVNRATASERKYWEQEYPGLLAGLPKDEARIAQAVGHLRAQQRLWSRRPGDDRFLRSVLANESLPSEVTLGGDRTENTLPLLCDLRAGPASFAGCADHAAAQVIQLAILSGPRSVGLVAVLGSPDEEKWGWLHSLPHTWDPPELAGTSTVTSDAESGEQILLELMRVVRVRSNVDGWNAIDGSDRHLVVVVSENAVNRTEAWEQLGAAGTSVGVHVIWITVPGKALASTRTYVARSSASTPAHPRVEIQSPVRTDLSVIRAVAKALTPLKDAPIGSSSVGSLPTALDFEDLFEEAGRASRVETIREGWRIASLQRGSDRFDIRCRVGVDATGDAFDVGMRTHGPHGLVVGTTGSGKSEFLRTLLAALALNYSPEDLNFLLVDFKGGAGFGPLVELPHVCGFVSDLEASDLGRLLGAMRAEITRRERIVRDHGVGSLNELEARLRRHGAGLDQRPQDRPFPVLLVVLDEFAALADESDAAVRDVIDIGRRGRSLGVHLLLSTQRPTVSSNLLANLNLRVALRTATDDDSQTVLGSPVAGRFPNSIYGRAAVKSGPDEPAIIQTAYASGPDAQSDCDRVKAEKWGFVSDLTAQIEVETLRGRTYLESLCERLADAAAGVRAAPLWFPSLPEIIDFGSVALGGDSSVPQTNVAVSEPLTRPWTGAVLPNTVSRSTLVGVKGVAGWPIAIFDAEDVPGQGWVWWAPWLHDSDTRVSVDGLLLAGARTLHIHGAPQSGRSNSAAAVSLAALAMAEETSLGSPGTAGLVRVVASDDAPKNVRIGVIVTGDNVSGATETLEHRHNVRVFRAPTGGLSADEIGAWRAAAAPDVFTLWVLDEVERLPAGPTDLVETVRSLSRPYINEAAVILGSRERLPSGFDQPAANIGLAQPLTLKDRSRLLPGRGGLGARSLGARRYRVQFVRYFESPSHTAKELS